MLSKIKSHFKNNIKIFPDEFGLKIIYPNGFRLNSKIICHDIAYLSYEKIDENIKKIFDSNIENFIFNLISNNTYSNATSANEQVTKLFDSVIPNCTKYLDKITNDCEILIVKNTYAYCIVNKIILREENGLFTVKFYKELVPLICKKN